LKNVKDGTPGVTPYFRRSWCFLGLGIGRDDGLGDRIGNGPGLCG
jgi:hypothetical protein